MTLAPVLGLGFDLGLAVLLSLAGLVTAVLAGLGLAVFLRRRSRPHLLVAFALVALFTRTVVASVALVGVLDATPHHLVEHALDAALASLVVGAVYYARSVDRARATTRR